MVVAMGGKGRWEGGQRGGGSKGRGRGKKRRKEEIIFITPITVQSRV